MLLKEWMTKQIPMTFIHWKSLRSPKQSMLLLKPFSGGLYLTYSRISLQQSSLMGEKMTVNGVIFLPFTEEWQSFFLFWASYQSTSRCRRTIAVSEFSIFLHTTYSVVVFYSNWRWKWSQKWKAKSNMKNQTVLQDLREMSNFYPVGIVQITQVTFC